MSTESMVTQAALEPCPFCGCEAEFHPTFWGLQPQISCQCGAKVWAHSEAEALSAWNTRTAAQPEREAVALLRELRDNIGAASLARNPIGMSIRDRVDIFLRDAALTTPAPAVSTDAEPLPVEYYLWLASIEPDVRVRDLTAAEVADLLSRIRGEGK